MTRIQCDETYIKFIKDLNDPFQASLNHPKATEKSHGFQTWIKHEDLDLW